MKQNLKLMAIAAVFLTAAISSCKPESANGGKTEVPEPAMVSFKFELAKNASALSADAVGELKGNDVAVSLPATANLTVLVATFEVAEGNVVKVNGVKQESGVTVNDFTNPVDYIVTNSDGTKNTLYTVKVNGVKGKWKLAGTYAELPLNNAKMKVNKANGKPYILFKEKSVTGKPSESANKLTLLQFDGAGFATVGKAGFSETVNSSEFDVDFGPSGIPYVTYATSAKRSAVALKYDGKDWNYVVKDSISDMQSTKLNISVAADNNIVLTQVNTKSKNCAFGRNNFVVSASDGSKWDNALVEPIQVNPIYNAVSVASGNAVYSALIYRKTVAGVNYGHEVLKYADGIWTSLRKNYVHSGATGTGIFVAPDIKAASDGVVYLMTPDNAEDNAVYHFRVERYIPETKAWEAVGAPIPYVHGDRHDMAKLGIAPDGTPYLVYYDTKNTTVFSTYFDKETKQWSEPVKVIENESINDLCFVFSSNGFGYITVIDANGAARVYIYK